MPPRQPAAAVRIQKPVRRFRAPPPITTVGSSPAVSAILPPNASTASPIVRPDGIASSSGASSGPVTVTPPRNTRRLRATVVSNAACCTGSGPARKQRTARLGRQQPLPAPPPQADPHDRRASRRPPASMTSRSSSLTTARGLPCACVRSTPPRPAPRPKPPSGASSAPSPKPTRRSHCARSANAPQHGPQPSPRPCKSSFANAASRAPPKADTGSPKRAPVRPPTAVAGGRIRYPCPLPPPTPREAG